LPSIRPIDPLAVRRPGRYSFAMVRPANKATALWVLRRLRKHGFQSLFAGGCVRDMLIGSRSSDYDVATDASPQQVRRLFPHVLLVGAKFGVAMVIHRGQKVEVTTFRSDVSYTDGRRPDAVRFSSARQDALRRDFTINGMFYDPLEDRLIDYVGGQADLRRRIIRTIGPPDQRFAEDYLRMLRAVRLAVRLDFSIDPATQAALRKNAASIVHISGERIFDELGKMLSSASADRAIGQLEEVGLARHLFGELFTRPGLWDTARRTVAMVAGKRDAVLCLAALLGDLPEKTICQIIRRWGGSNDLKNALCWLGRQLPRWLQADKLSLIELKKMLACPHFERLRILWRARERIATGRQTISRRLSRRMLTIEPGEIAPTPLITGEDLLGMGLAPGPAFGRIVKQVYDAQLNRELKNRSQALKFARNLIARQGKTRPGGDHKKT